MEEEGNRRHSRKKTKVVVALWGFQMGWFEVGEFRICMWWWGLGEVGKGSVLPYNNSSLRSLLVFGKSSKELGVGKQQGILEIAIVFKKLNLLRVLDITEIKTYDGIMPKEIGNLIHLRYLRIRSTNIRELPKSIGKLCKLLTFDYRDILGDSEIILPDIFWKLEKLKYLFLPTKKMCNTISNLKLDTLKELQTLWGVKAGDWMFKEMATLSKSLTKLHIQAISSEEQFNAVIQCPAIRNLYALVLDWYGFSSLDCIDKLCSNEEIQIKKLRLLGRAPDLFKPLKFPSNLWKLELYYTHLKEEKTMNALGMLPHLKFLRLAKDSFLGSKWTCKENTFTSLEELILSNLPYLENWMMESKTMECLKKLSIISCTRLQRLPEKLQLITNLEGIKIQYMPTSFCSRLRRNQSSNKTSQGGEDIKIVQHVPNLTIDNSYTSIPLP
ncbi:Disease resistance protein RPH8A [Bienertia sinuspersici]